MHDLVERIASLPPRKRALLAMQNPLSFAQERLWFLDQLDPGAAIYNVPAGIDIEGELCVRSLELALLRVVERHDILRARFPAFDGVPLQINVPATFRRLPLVDLSKLAEPQRQAELARWTTIATSTPFDLIRQSLLRVFLLRLDQRKHRFLVTMHHIICDGWSLEVFFRELRFFYEEVQAGGRECPPELPLQYADYARWQRKTLSGDRLRAELGFWKGQVEPVPEPLQLPTDRPRPVAPTFAGAWIWSRLPQPVMERCRQLGQQHRATSFHTLLALFQLFLLRLTGRYDFVLGSPVAHRDRAEIEGLIGFFLNTLALRSRCSPGQSFQQLLEETRQQMLSAHSHQHLPFEKLVTELEVGRDLGRQPVFQILFTLKESPSEAPRQAASGWSRIHDLGRRVAMFDLTFTVIDGGDEVVQAVEYSTELFDHTTIRRYVQSFENLLGAILERPEDRLESFSLHSRSERHQVLQEWSRGAELCRPAGAPWTLNGLVRAQAARTPGAVAVSFRGYWLNYAELESKARLLARYLQGLGVGPDTAVGLCVERGLSMTWAVLGILEAGGAYLALDPVYPAERIGYILTDAKASVVVTQSTVEDVLPAGHGAVVVRLDSDWSRIAGAPPPAAPPAAAGAENLAYILYTSGSTGRPKGVAIPHGSAVALVLWAREHFPADSLAAVMAATSLCFDLSVYELFVPLSSGGRVIVAANALELPELQEAEQVRLVNTVPSVMAEVLRQDGLPDGVRTVNLAGEPLPRDLVETLYEAGAEAVYNLYGPSEDTTYSTFARIPGGETARPTIGRPIAGTRALVLDRTGQAVAIGAIGELFLGGRGLARGYVGRPALTAERFLPDPFSETPGERLYRTGDGVRLLTGGELDFLGRLDHQVKVRGFRIEPGEIEEALRSYQGVGDAVVLARVVGNGPPSLVAYVVPEGGAVLEAGSLRSFLRRTLPDYMVPTFFIPLAELPRTPNGKLDRRALPEPSRPRQETRELAAAAGTVGEVLAGLWKRILGVAEVSPEDNFFEVGGHSLLATRMVSQIRQTLRVEISVRTVFEAPTLGALTEKVARQHGGVLITRSTGSGEQMNEILARIRSLSPQKRALLLRKTPLSFAQERLWFLDQLEPGSPAYNVPAALRLEGELRPRRLASSLGKVFARHSVLRTRFPSVEGEPFQIVSPPTAVPLPLVDLGALAPAAREETLRRLASREAGRSFDLAEGPLVAFVLVRLAARDHVLLTTIHHIICDGWSLEILFAEMRILYLADLAGQPPSLPELPLQYVDFARWQRQRLTGEHLERQLGYWKGQLEPAPPPLELPADRPRPPVPSYQGAWIWRPMPRELTEALREASREQQATPFMALLAVFKLLIFRLTGQLDFAVGTPIVNRPRTEVEGLVGFFLNTLVLRTSLAEDLSFGDLLELVRQQTLAAHSHQELPFERLVAELEMERDLSHQPLFQVMFTLKGAPPAPPAAEGLAFSRFHDVELKVSPFDLTFTVVDGGSELVNALELSTDLFDQTTVRRWLRSFEILTEQVLEDPSRELGQFSLLDSAERHQVLVEWNDTRTRCGPPWTLPAAIAEQVAATPDAVAVEWREQSLTYRQLDRRASALARRLAFLGVGPEAVVGVAVDRSPEMLVGVLAILKAGGAYLPLDPRLPAERVSYILDDSKAGLILCDAAARERLRKVAGERGARLLDPSAVESQSGREATPFPVHPANPAYVLYTSGSTGRPKGVQGVHRELTGYARTAIGRFAITAGDRVLQFASLGFDTSMEEIFPALMGGATLVLPDSTEVLPPADFCALAAKRRLSMLDLPTAYWHELSASPELAVPASARLVVLGGERAAASRLADWQRATDQRIRLINSYGLTETTIVNTMFPVASGYRNREIPIGRPIDNARIYIADRRMRLAPMGVVGEVLIAGAGLARGYLHQARLTAERYLPDPWSSEPGARLYRSGDLGRLLGGGAVEHVGRVDHQLKIRGVRIEIGELEEVLLSCPGVLEAAVVAAKKGQEISLGAFYATERAGPKGSGGEGSHSLEPRDLRNFLGRFVPEIMVPGVFRRLESLPKNTSGKLDRRSLSELMVGDVRGPDEARSQAPRGLIEESLAELWGKILELPAVGRETDFFSVGGHSLLATRLVSRVRSKLGVDLAVRDLFEAPTVAALARRIVRLDQRPISAAPPVEPLARRDGVPLSFAQQRLWLLERLDPGNISYNLPSAYQLRGPLRDQALERALGEIVRRHEALRTTFDSSGKEPVQRITSPGEVALPLVDLGALPAAERRSAATGLVAFEARRPFDLEQGPMWRALLVRTGEKEHLFSLVLHHVVSDGWSGEVLAIELEALYRAYAAGEPSPLPELPVQYGDYSVWQRRWLDGETLERLLGFWRREQADPPPALELPIDRPRPSRPRFEGGRSWHRLPGELADELRRLGQEAGATGFMSYLALSNLLLFCYSGQRDFNIGTPVAGRDRLELEGLVGFFVNTLVVRSALRGDPSFRQLLAATRQRMLDAQAHQDIPFERLVEELDPERDQSHTPLFQVMVLSFAAPDEPRPFGDLSMTTLQPDLARSKFDWTLAFLEQDGGLIVGLEYVKALFDPTTVQRVLRQAETLLHQVTAHPDRPLSQLELLSASERQQVVVEWNDSGSTWPAGGTLVDLFEAQVDHTPLAVAVRCGDAVFTYEELDRRANVLAGTLLGRGVESDSMVGLCVERGVDLVWAVLGILKAGAGYLALDPGHPPDRISYMLADAGSKIVVCDRAVRQVLPAGHGAELLCLEDHPWGVEATDRPELRIAENQLAYVLYTSGSTGKPKGVAITHQSAVTLVRWSLRRFDREAFDGMLGATSLAFDLSVFELFATLSCGGTFLVAEDALELPTLVDRKRVRLVNTVPSVMDEMVRGGMIGPQIHTVTLAGEPLSRELADAILATGARNLFNLYGPSEDTTWSTGRPMIAGETGRPPIGPPLADTQLYILDHGLRPVPTGAVGEIYLGGAGLARGYYHQPRLTAEKFVPDPFSRQPGGRLYRTADLGRFLPSGEPECLGRADHQVKVRGFRVELGEIETTLRAIPGVEESAVVVRDLGDSGRSLVAYVSGGEETCRPGPLREALGRSLPDYMVPSLFVILDALPRTPSGKIDRRSLPAAERSGDRAEAPPEGLAEEMMAAIWCEVLGLESVGRDRDFFDLGGHSLLATQVTSRVREAFGVELPMRALFDASTVARLTVRVSEAQKEGGAGSAPVLQRFPRAGAVPLSFTQQRLWFLDRLEGASAAYNLPVAFRWLGALDTEALHGALCDIVARHEALRTGFRLVGEEPAQFVADKVAVELPVADLSRTPEAERERELMRRARAEIELPFDLSRPPLIRGRVLRVGVEDHVVVLILHHIVADGWSMQVLRRELGALYEGRVRGEAMPLPELPVQVADFSIWQRQWLRGPALREKLGFWRELLRDVPDLLELPTDRPRPMVQTYDGSWLGAPLPQEVTAGVGAVAQAAEATLFMTCLAAFGALLGRVSGAADLCVGTPISGRTHLQLEPLIGFFANTLVLRVDLRGTAPTFFEVLRRVRETTLGAFSHQDLPFEKLVEELAPERSLDHSPLFQVLFSLQEGLAEGRGSGELGGAAVRSYPVPLSTAKFDLSLALHQQDGRWLAGFEYNTNLFDRTTVLRLSSAFDQLLRGVAADPHRRLAEISLLGDAERHQVLVEWNDTAAGPARETRLSDLFEAQVDRTPTAVAVRRRGRELTYGEVERRANRLAHHLLALGVAPEEVVGICVERGVDMVWALLGILKAGAAYLALDPAYPADRVGLMLDDAGARFVVTTSAAVDVLPGEAAAHRVFLDRDAGVIATRSDRRPALAGDLTRLAYILYTSGSTGRPKGVAIPQAGAVALVRWALEEFSAESLEVVLAATSICFDLSVYEIFLPLAMGGQVVVAKNALELPELPEAGQVRLVNTVPSVMAELVRSGSLPAGVHTVNLAGEPLPRDLVETLYSLGARDVYNLYGPSEDTTYSTFARIPGGVDERPSIGRPLARTWALVLDPSGWPVPIGVVGELYLGGRGLARGYHGQPALTAQSFVPDSFSPEPGGRLYRTGDAVRWRPGGELDFLGRLDHQVKVRGFRIEPGEIEAALRALDGIEEAVVVARKGPSGDLGLVAYVVVPLEAVPELAALRQALRSTLPESMVPASWVRLESVPRTPSGKIDRRALPVPEQSRERAGLVLPRTGRELVLARIWADLLGLQAVGVTEDFFHLGGHSLLAVRLQARLQAELGVELPLAAFFDGSTVERLAARLDGAGPAAAAAASLVPIQLEGSKPPLFLVHPVGGSVFCYLPLARHLGAEQPVYGFTARGLDGGTEPLARIEDLASAYLEELLRLRPEGPYHLGGWSMGGLVAFEMARQLRSGGREASSLTLVDTSVPDPVREPIDEATRLSTFARDLGLGSVAQWLDRGDDRNSVLAHLLEQARKDGRVPPEIGMERFLNIYGVFEANFLAAMTYDPRPYGGDLTYFEAGENLGFRRSPRQWSDLATGTVRVHTLPGNHYTLLHEPNVSELTEILRRVLAG